MASIFTKIINGEIPCYKVAENDDFFAFLDISPLQKGHTLVVPKKEIDYMFSMDDKHIAAFIIFAKKVALAIEKTIDCKRVGLSVIGLEVAHAHIHLVPMQDGSEISFTNPKMQFSSEEMQACADAISQNI